MFSQLSEQKGQIRAGLVWPGHSSATLYSLCLGGDITVCQKPDSRVIHFKCSHLKPRYFLGDKLSYFYKWTLTPHTSSLKKLEKNKWKICDDKSRLQSRCSNDNLFWRCQLGQRLEWNTSWRNYWTSLHVLCLVACLARGYVSTFLRQTRHVRDYSDHKRTKHWFN